MGHVRKVMKNPAKSVFVYFMILMVIALLANHLTLPEYFPTHPDYEFPMEGVLFTVFFGAILAVIAEKWYAWYKDRYFSKGVRLNQIITFLAGLMGLIAAVYLVIYPLANFLIGGEADLYYFLNGFLVSLMMSFILAVLIYGVRIYQLSRQKETGEKLRVCSGNQIIFMNFSEIAYFYSLEKTVYLVKTDGNRVVTDFVLNKLEEQLSDETFFRANRQALVHRQSVVKVVPDVNGKKNLELLPAFLNKDTLIISRYKAKEFENWLLHKAS